MQFDKDLQSIQEVRDLISRALEAQEEYASFMLFEHISTKK